jgi:hypothetical protein
MGGELYVAGRAGSADVMVRLQGARVGRDPDLAVVRIGGRRVAFSDVDGDGWFDRVVVSATDDLPARSVGFPYPDPLREIGDDVHAESSGVPGLEWSAVSLVGGREDPSALVYELDEEALANSSAEAREDDVRKAALGTDFAWVG